MEKRTWGLVAVLVILALLAIVPIAVAQYQTKIYFDNGGNRMVVAPTGQVVIQSGGGLSVQSGGSFRLTPGAVSDAVRFKSTPGLTQFCSTATFTGTQAIDSATHGLTGGVLFGQCWMAGDPAGKAATCSTSTTGVTTTLKVWNTALTPVAGEAAATVGYCVTGY